MNWETKQEMKNETTKELRNIVIVFSLLQEELNNQ